ncbi:hypothetical protein RHIZ404_190418 [Rhizobium sp. EC-SD404]|nr:hypothetical protein RHIZ404_190418 [Rhizobium sp. EC-SD404]
MELHQILPLTNAPYDKYTYHMERSMGGAGGSLNERSRDQARLEFNFWR